VTAQINFKTELSGDFDSLIDRVTSALKGEGFGILTRIDMHAKIEEKIGKKLPKVVILGACNPTMAYEAYTANSDVASLLPCNVVVRDIGTGKVSIEIIKPSAMMKVLGDKKLDRLAQEADVLLKNVIDRL
jgi:uncharacterized protein (DUF302 family)